MAELKKEEAKKDLQNMLSKSKAGVEKEKEALMTPEERKTADEAKVEVEKKRIETEAKAKKDAELLATKDEDITDEADKKRKVELLDKQKKDEEANLSADEKVKRIQEKTQKRIDEISTQLKAVENKHSTEADEFRRQLKIAQDEKTTLEKKLLVPEAEDEIESLVDEEEGKRIDKYLEEDKDKPREKRREMPQEELDDWLVEELGKAQAWLSKREVRRDKERDKDRFSKGQEKYVKNLMGKQGESTKRAWTKHPELDVNKREKELKDEGKNPQEIHKILCEERPKHKIVCDLLAENPQRYMSAENGPELLTEDMEKRIAAPPATDDKQKQIDDLIKQVEDLAAIVQQLEITDVGVSSTVHRRPAAGEYSSAIKQFIKTAIETKLPQEKIDKRVKEMQAAEK